ncbi:hypothetical protein JZ751_028724 [Albula glossodonta]|uniref:A to I editase domain-containing protein n=1 Tax=Albula glossodonta TaxID=121402 RepID=A0A8T2NAG3_9TELE|nr:hypothetical protein JZ751_028724 [Albula glossodonta]
MKAQNPLHCDLTAGELDYFKVTITKDLSFFCPLTVTHALSPLLKTLCPMPSVSGLSSSDVRQPGKSPCFSVNWTAGDGQLEVINTATGKRKDTGASSRLCKHALFTRWAKLYHKVSSVTSLCTTPRHTKVKHDTRPLSTQVASRGETPLMYCEAKLAARTYQTVKQQLFRSLQEAGLGTWVKKPPEQDQFVLSV